MRFKISYTCALSKALPRKKSSNAKRTITGLGTKSGSESLSSTLFKIGSIQINPGDIAEVDGLAYCSNRDGQVLIPDGGFVISKAYEDTRNYYKKNNIRGVFAQLNGPTYGDFAELKTYLLAKYLWNPDLKEEDVTLLEKEIDKILFDISSVK